MKDTKNKDAERIEASQPEPKTFFVPGIGEIEADTLEDAARQAEQLTKKAEVDDGDI